MKQLSFRAPGRSHLLVCETAAGQLPAAPPLPPAFEPFLYLQPAHQALQKHGHPVLAFFLSNETHTTAQLYVVSDAAGPGAARSPAQATFGGAQVAAGVAVEALHELFATAENTLRARGQRTLEIRGYPFCYDPAGAALLAETLRQRGYEVPLAEQNYYLDLARDYAAHLHPSARRRLRAAQRAGLVLEQEPLLLLPWAYEFIANCRAERGQPPLSLPLARLQELFRAFPRQHFLLSVREAGSGRWAALTVAIQASARVLHNFYPASPLAFNQLSPAVLLTGGLHQLGRDLGLQVLDLGRSTLGGGEPHDSLLQFKRGLGGIVDEKLTWYKPLAGDGS